MKSVQEQLGPLWISKQRPALPGLGGDEVGFTGRRLLSSRSQIEFPQGLKPRFIIGLYGVPKGTPLQNLVSPLKRG